MDMQDREQRKENLIVHNLVEPSPEMKNGYKRKKLIMLHIRKFYTLLILN